MDLSVLQIEKLVKKSQKGDEDSFAELFDFFYPKIHRYIKFRVEEEEVDDLVGEVFFKVIANLKKYNPLKNKGSFSAWVFRIAHNLIIDYYRQKKDLVRLIDPENDEIIIDVPDSRLDPHDSAIKHEEHRKISKILKKLSDIHREVLELKFLEGFTNPEIAQITGKTEGNIRVIQLRALREMRKYFREEIS